MRVALVHARRKNHPKWDWIRDAMVGLGHEVIVCHDFDAVVKADRLRELLLFEQRSVGIDENSLIGLSAARRATWAMWCFDLIATMPGGLLSQPNLFSATAANGSVPTPWLKLMRAMDVVFVKERELLSEYALLGVPAWYLDQAFPRHIGCCAHIEHPPWDVLVVGSSGRPWRQRRHDAEALMAEGLVVAWAGHPGADGLPPGCLPLPWCHPDFLPGLVSQAAVTLGVDARQDVVGYWSDRLWLLLGVGACHVQRWSPGLPDGPYMVYRDHKELVGHVKRLTANVNKRGELGAAARQWVLGHHTYEDRCRELLKVVRCKSRTREPAERATANAV